MKKIGTFITTLIFFGCQENDPKKVETDLPDAATVIQAYAQKGNWTIEQMNKELIGEWKWVKCRCASFFNPIEDDFTKYKNCSIRINSNGLLDIFENSTLILTREWSIAESGSQTNTDPPAPIYLFYLLGQEPVEPLGTQLGGFVFIANDILIFSRLPVDGCDSFFVKQ